MKRLKRKMTQLRRRIENLLLVELRMQTNVGLGSSSSLSCFCLMQIADLKAKPTDLRLRMRVNGSSVVERNIFFPKNWMAVQDLVFDDSQTRDAPAMRFELYSFEVVRGTLAGECSIGRSSHESPDQEIRPRPDLYPHG